MRNSRHTFLFVSCALTAGSFCLVRAGLGQSEGLANLQIMGGSADVDGDGHVDLDDYRSWPPCHTGPGGGVLPGDCPLLDFDNDNDVDLHDFEEFQRLFIPPPPPAGDRCNQAVPIFGEDAFPFNNANATRDGPDHVACAASGTGQINNDIWMCWNAPCNGIVVVDTCGLTTIDSKIAVYSGCTCPVTDGRLLACNDDEPQCGVQARTTFAAVANFNYLIRVGSYPGSAGGSGSVRISCGFDACPNPDSDCFTAHGNVGCADEACCNKLCSVDSWCCEMEYDATCVEEARGLCGDGFDTCGLPTAGDCQTVSEKPGCSDEACCNAVCSNNPECCLLAWDLNCVEDYEPSTCFTACQPGAGNCYSTHANPGCETESCCAQVCPRDPFCCRTAWDEACVELAQFYCN